MRPVAFPFIPLFIAGAALVFAGPVLQAQQEHDHAASAPAGKACACCGNSGSGSMNHEAAPGAADQGTGTAPAPGPMLNRDAAGGGCCGTMAMKGRTPAQSAAAMKPAGSKGCCTGMAMGKGERSAASMADGDASMMSDMQLFHYLLENRADIRRTVTILPNGIDTLTESDKPEVATKLKVHVSAMYVRLREGRPIHQRDPLFAELFSHADQIDANITYTDKGLHVVETSTDPAVAHLLHKHAETVDRFIKNGMPEMMKDHLDD